MRADRRRRETEPQPGAWLRPALVSVGYLLAGATAWLLVNQGLAWLQRPDTLPVERIRTMNTLNYSDPADLQNTLAPLVRTGLFAVDATAIKTVLEARPWIDQVTVRRSWPATVELFVTEHQPVARFAEAALATDRGQVIYPESIAGFEALPRLLGDEAAAADLVTAARILQNDELTGAWQLQELRGTAQGALHARFAKGPALQLGSGDLRAALHRLAQVLPMVRRTAARHDRALAALDLRYEHGAAASWQPLPEPLAHSPDKGGKRG